MALLIAAVLKDNPGSEGGKVVTGVVGNDCVDGAGG
jgi:hypothetical protein